MLKAVKAEGGMMMVLVGQKSQNLLRKVEGRFELGGLVALFGG